MAFSRILLFFCLTLLLPSPLLWAWNEDFSPLQPGHRGVCIRDLSALSRGFPVTVRSIPGDEVCEEGENRYQWVIGQEPKGAMALLPHRVVQKTFPPWVPSWPSSENSASPRVWHFTCVGNVEKDLLGTKLKSIVFKGEITAPVKYQSCESAYAMAQAVCAEQLGGSDLYEQCSGGSNYLLDLP